MITSATDPRDERFVAFLREAEDVGERELPILDRIERVGSALRAVAESVEMSAPPSALSGWCIQLCGWALSPDPIALEPGAMAALHALRRDRVRGRNVARGVVDWVLGQTRVHAAELQASWRALHDVAMGYPLDPQLRIPHPADASAQVAVWSYAVLRANVARHARGIRTAPTTLAEAARAGKRRQP